MVYIQRQVRDVSYIINCPCCDYSTKKSNSLLRHLKKCDEFWGDSDDIESKLIDKNLTIGDIVQILDAKISLTKEFIQSNELEQLQTHSSEQIREYIRNKLMLVIPYKDDLTFDVFEIYEFFFGLTSDDENIRNEWLKNKIMKMF